MLESVAMFLTADSGIRLLYFLILLPAVLGFLYLIVPRKAYGLHAAVFLLAMGINLLLSASLLYIDDFSMLIPWVGFEINLSLRIYSLSKYILLLISVCAFFVALYSVSFVKDKVYSQNFFFYFLITISVANGTLLANNMVILLFFWSTWLFSLFGMLLSLRSNGQIANKALIMNAIPDLFFLMGIVIICTQANSMMMNVISDLSLEGPGLIGFVCITIGALGKIGVVPFHSWIPDSSRKASTPFLVFIIGFMSKILGVYLLIRVFVDFYNISIYAREIALVSTILGLITYVLCSLMAINQKDIRKALSYLSISQSGFILMAFASGGTKAVFYGLYHLIVCSFCLCALFMIVGVVHKFAGSTKLTEISGLGKLMPISGICFTLAACSLCGLPPFCGHSSAIFVLDIVKNTGTVLYAFAFVGVFFTAASMLKLAHSIFFGPVRLPESVEREQVHEAPGAMILPLLLFSLSGLAFGIYNVPVSDFVSNALGVYFNIGWGALLQHLPSILIFVVVLLLALLNHMIGAHVTGNAYMSLDHFRTAPGLKQFFWCAENHYLDLYNFFKNMFSIIAWLCYCIERGISWIYDSLIVKAVVSASTSLRNFNYGNLSVYMVWVIGGMAFVALLFLVLI